MVIFSTLITCGCIGTDEDFDKRFEINIEIDPESTDEYEIFLPVPVKGYANWAMENEGQPIDPLTKLEMVEGNGTFNITKIEDEYFLYIKSSNRTRINYRSENELPDPFEDLSSNKIYYNSTSNSTVMINYNIEYYIEDSKEFTWSLSGYKTKIGWQEVEIERELEIID